jgi:ACS family glucarate transporter-like MFS transporter
MSQFWAIGIQYFITDYILYVFLVWLTLYLMEAQNFLCKKWVLLFLWLVLLHG